MDIFGQALSYGQSHAKEFWQHLGEHLILSFLALGIAIAVCVPLGMWTSSLGRTARLIVNGVGIARVVPSIAVLLVLYPVFGLGFTPALVALTVLAFPPILINTDTGLREVDRSVVEAAQGMGMTGLEQLWKVKLPLALPLIIGGIRTAAIEVIASAALATFIGAGGLGDFINQGLEGNSDQVLLVGAIPVALLALTVELSLATLQRFVTPKLTVQN